MDKNKDNMLLRWKRKLSSVHMYSITLVILSLILGLAIYQYKDKLNFKTYLQNTFQESFYESAKYVDNVDNLLAKIKLTKKPEQRIPIFTDIYKQSAAAQENMSRLPYNQAVISNVLKFLSQLSDFSYSMIIKSSEGKELTLEEKKQINQLASYSNKLTKTLNKIKSNINDGNTINWKEIQKEGQQQLKEGAKQITGSLVDVKKDFQDYPSLIYDGPFSDHIEQMEPELLKNKKVITKGEAKEIATNFIGKDRVEEIELVFVTKTKAKYVIPVYRFQVKLKDNVNSEVREGVLENSEEPTTTIDITQQGGKVLWILNYREMQDDYPRNLMKVDEVQKKVKMFLENNQYPNMEVNYYEQVGNTVIFNYAYKQGEVTVYSDLIKVKASLLDGEILGIESLGYIMMHKERDIPQVKLTKSKAREEIVDNFKVDRVKLALVPLESKRDTLTWEFKGKQGEKEFLIYINAQTGKQEKILQVLRNKNGVFTQ